MSSSIGESQRTLSESVQRYTQKAPRYQGEFSSHNTYYVKKTILLDKYSEACYTDYVDSHRGFLEYQRRGSSHRYLREDSQTVCVLYSTVTGQYMGGCLFLLCMYNL